MLDPARARPHRHRPDASASRSKRERRTPIFRDTVVTLLLDNSGSMARPADQPVAANLRGTFLARTLERCGVKVEILGFTTRAWKGRASRAKAWARRRQGRPIRAGSTTCATSSTSRPTRPWRALRRKESRPDDARGALLKENIDGEGARLGATSACWRAPSSARS